MRGLEEAAAPAMRCLLEACVDVEVILVRSCRRPVYFVWGITNGIILYGYTEELYYTGCGTRMTLTWRTSAFCLGKDRPAVL
jgi:hypothetical protein